MVAMTNQAAWIRAATTTPLEVGPGPEPSPLANEVVIKVAYAAVNPIDWKIQGFDFIGLPYPFVLGMDVAGTVAKVGSAVTRFTKGQRVIGQCAGFYTHKPTDMAFQNYATCPDALVAAIPDSIAFANAVVLPLGTSTAAAAFYSKEFLNLELPTTNPIPQKKTMLIWGGSSSVGSCAIQLGTLSGYEVFTTASPHNYEYVKGLGAKKVFDHSGSNVVEEIVEAIKKTEFAGAFDAISSESTMRLTAEVISKLGGGILPTTLPPPSEIPNNVKAANVSGLAPAYEAKYLGPAIWGKFLPEALAKGLYQAKPDPLVVKGGLSKVQEAIEMSRNGVSARKVVVEIDATV